MSFLLNLIFLDGDVKQDENLDKDNVNEIQMKVEENDNVFDSDKVINQNQEKRMSILVDELQDMQNINKNNNKSRVVPYTELVDEKGEVISPFSLNKKDNNNLPSTTTTNANTSTSTKEFNIHGLIVMWSVAFVFSISTSTFSAVVPFFAATSFG